MAEAFSEACDELEKAEDFEAAVHELIKSRPSSTGASSSTATAIPESGWRRKRRGLPNIPTMVDATPALTTDKSVAMFEKFGVFTKTELESRSEVEYETYAKKINIEAKAMIDIISKQVIPAVIKYTTVLADSITSVKAAVPSADISTQTEKLEEVSKLLTEANKALEVLVKDQKETEAIEEMEKRAHVTCDKLVPDLVRKYLATVVPAGDNYYAALNSAVFSDGSFCYVPKGVKCPMELSSYFRINAAGTGQFERTLIVADEGAQLSYMEGCTAPMRDENQLHAAVVEIIVEKDADVKYSTVQNWYPGDAQGRGGILNLVTKRGICRGSGSHLSWTQVETGSAVTWKYPSTILKGDYSSSEFYSVAMTNNWQQADTGTKMIHLGRGTRSRVVSKGISAGHSENSYRGLVQMGPAAEGARNYSQCDSLLIGSRCGAHTFPVIRNQNPHAVVEHEATTSKISEDQLFYCTQRGIAPEDAVALIVGGYAREVLARLPMEFAVEAQKLLSVSLEGAVG